MDLYASCLNLCAYVVVDDKNDYFCVGKIRLL